MNPTYSPGSLSEASSRTSEATRETVELNTGRKRQALLHAQQLFENRVDWLTYFREILGVDGIVRQLFPSQSEYLAFEATPEFAEIESQLFKLKSERRDPSPKEEPTRVITVRLPESVHEALRAEALDHQTSINKLCIAKLLQAISEEIAPPARRQDSRGSALRSYAEGVMPRTETEAKSVDPVAVSANQSGSMESPGSTNEML